MNWAALEKKYDSTNMKEHIENQGKSIAFTINNELGRIREVAKRVRGCDNFIFSGCGDKHIVAIASQFLWNYLSDKRLDVIQSKILANYPPKNLNKKSCVVFISQSGTTADTVEACKLAMKREASIVLMTNLKENKAGSLVELCQNYKKGFVLRTHTENYPEKPLPSTGTFHTSLTLLNLFVLALHNNDKLLDLQLNYIPRLVHELSIWKNVKDWSKSTAEKLKAIDNLYVVGDGPRFAIARKHAKIMMMEGAKANACDVEAEEFVHSLIGTLEGKPNHLVLLKPLNEWNYASVNYEIIKKLWPANKLIEIDPFQFLDEGTRKAFNCYEGDLLSPFLYIVPCEWQSYYLSLLKGRDPGKSSHVSKVRNENELKRFLI
jgi:fructoselysine-6-P-deglycase FrlB-like protein